MTHQCPLCKTKMNAAPEVNEEKIARLLARALGHDDPDEPTYTPTAEVIGSQSGGGPRSTTRLAILPAWQIYRSNARRFIKALQELE